MIQYANCPDPVENAARRERVRHAEELGEFKETAEQMVRASLPVKTPIPGRIDAEDVSSSQERRPISQRLGPSIVSMGVPKPKKKNMGKRKPGRPPGKKPSPKPLVGGNSKKRKMMNAQPSPRRRLVLETGENVGTS